MNKNKWFLNGGRGSGKTFRLLCEAYENKITDLQNKVEEKENRIVELEMTVGTLRNFSNEQATCIERLEKENTRLNARLNAINLLTPELEKAAKQRRKQLTKAKELLRFWVNDFYDSFNHSNKYEARHKALVEAEQFLKEE